MRQKLFQDSFFLEHLENRQGARGMTKKVCPPEFRPDKLGRAGSKGGAYIPLLDLIYTKYWIHRQAKIRCELFVNESLRLVDFFRVITRSVET